MNVLIDCPCPPKAGEPRHDQDTVTLREHLDFRSGVTMRKAIALLYAEDPGATGADVLAVLTEHYLLEGIEAWTLVDDKGERIEPSKPAIRTFLADHPDLAMTVGDQADDLYAEQVLLPLVKRAQMSSPDSPTDGSTSARNGSSEKAPKLSKRSSTTTTPTDATASLTSLPAGDSSSSQSSASAA